MKALLENTINIFREIKPKYTQIITVFPEEQYYEYKCYKNDKYTHTVKLRYYTTKQLEEFKKF